MIALGILVFFVAVWALALGTGLAMGSHMDFGVGWLVRWSFAMALGLFVVLGLFALGGHLVILAVLA